jgi:hydrophobic/amphiphilic exporter-1 (mainly G- bacteria), HAE1 family
MLIMFLVVLGVFSFMGLGVDLFPQSDPAQVYVRLRLPGASPEEMVSQVVLPVEEAVSAISGIEELTARISEGNASVQIQFILERDIGEAVEDVREKVASPCGACRPIYSRRWFRKRRSTGTGGHASPVSGPRSAREITEIADKQIRRGIETVDGVASIEISGARARQVNIFLDINKLTAYNLTAQDVERALRTENVESPGGRIVRGPSEVGVRTMGRVEHVREFNDIIIKNVGGAPVRLRDIGFAEDGMAEKRTFAYLRGDPAVILEVQRQSGMNTVQVADGVLARVEEMRGQLPSDIRLEVVKEQASYIRASVAALEEHLVLGSLLASMIVFLFIRDWRTVLIAALAIPTSIITTFTVLKVMGYTLNSMTLLALTLAVGIVIDDAIIVLENIYRFLQEKGLPPKRRPSWRPRRSPSP